MERSSHRYLTVALAICVGSMIVGPPMPEHVLLRHLRRIERRIERSRSPDAAADSVRDYLQANTRNIDRVKQQLRAYSPERSLAAFRRLEGRLEKVSASISAQPGLARDLGDMLLDFMP